MSKQVTSLVGLMVTLCLVVAADKIYRFYEAHQPLAKVGECLAIISPLGGQIVLHIMSNDNINAISVANADLNVFPGVKIQVPIQVTYQELREAKATKVTCE